MNQRDRDLCLILEAMGVSSIQLGSLKLFIQAAKRAESIANYDDRSNQLISIRSLLLGGG